MAYDAPTVAEFKTRFPALVVGKSDPLIQMFLSEANRSVDNSWLEGDYKNAIMLLAAHNMTMEDAAAGSSGGGSGSIGVSSESFGGMSISYDKSDSSNDDAAKSEWGATEYGRRFYRLLKLNKPAIVSI